MTRPPSAFDFAPYRLSGTVYGVLMNQRAALAALGDGVNAAPYGRPPQAPVLYIKPRNALAGAGESVRVPAGVEALEVGATLGLVMGRTACRVDEGEALSYVAGYTVVNDISVPHESYYRPSLRFKARDGFCPMSAPVPGEVGLDPDALAVSVYLDEELIHRSSTGERLRPAARLIADVSEFMTLHPGDVLMLGVGAGAPRARAGQRVRIEIEGVGSLSHRFEAEEKTS